MKYHPSDDVPFTHELPKEPSEMRFAISLISADDACGKTQERMALGAIMCSHGGALALIHRDAAIQ